MEERMDIIEFHLESERLKKEAWSQPEVKALGMEQTMNGGIVVLDGTGTGS